MPIKEEAHEKLELKNTSNRRLAYKIKTTLPKLYCVRPNASIVEAGQTVSVSILRQPKEQPVQGERIKDKFLVLSHVVDEEHQAIAESDMAQLWSEFEKDKVNLDQQKIKVNYLFGESSGNTTANTTTSSVTPNAASTPATAATIDKADPVTLSSRGNETSIGKTSTPLSTSQSKSPAKTSSNVKPTNSKRSGSAEPGFPNSGNTQSIANQSLMGIPISAVAALFLAILLAAWWKFF